MTDIEPRPDCGEDSYVGSGRLTGRHALITGGDSGIGRSAAIAFAREGADIAINYLGVEQSDADSLRELIESTTNSSIYLIPGDIRNETFCNQLISTAAERLGGLDILYNNAGYGRRSANISSMTTENFIQTAETNIFAPFFLTRAAVPLMQPGSVILFTSSAMVRLPNYYLAAYAASKAWLATFAEALAVGLTLERGIRVNAVQPPMVLSPFLSTQGMSTEEGTTAAASSPWGRIMQPVEIAPLLVSLVESSASYSSGMVLGW